MDNLFVANEIDQVSLCNWYICSPETSLQYLNTTVHDLKLLHTNIRSLNCNFDKLLLFLSRLSYVPDIIILTECWLSKCPNIPILDGFNSCASLFQNQNDGVVVYFNSTLDVGVEIPIISDANCIIIKVAKRNAFINIYRSPSFKNPKPFLDSLDNLLANLADFQTVAVIGDLNINIAPDSTDPNMDDYLNLTASHAMLPAYTHPTRLSSCLDHVILRSHTVATALVLDSLITDHSPVAVFCALQSKNKTSILNYSVKVDVPLVIKCISGSDFNFIFQLKDPNLAAESVVSVYSSAVKSHSHAKAFPSRKRIIKPWITPGLLRCIRHKDKLYKAFKKDPENDTKELIFHRYRNFCNNTLKKVKREYERSEFLKARNSIKDTWKLIKQVANLDQGKSSSSELLNCCDDPALSVEVVNEYFVGIGSSLASKIQQSDLFKHLNSSHLHLPESNSLDTTPSLSMALYEVDCLELDNIILGLRDNCASGFDGVNATILKATRHVIVPVLVYIFNLCFSVGIFPDIFKTAVVLPIHKSGDKDSVTNYRPISLLSIFSKIFEKVINNRLTSYLTKFKILANNQFGFRSGRSTEDAVMELTDAVIDNIERRHKTIGVFLDLSKAFDTVSVPILLSKLEYIGIRGKVLDVFRSYMSGRKQFVRVGNFASNQRFLNYGVPQGSVLGPTLFLIYVNQLCLLQLPNCKIISYADDTALVVHGRDWDGARRNAELALHAVMNWLTKNLLTLNVSKTKFMTFSSTKSGQPVRPIEIHAHTCLNTAINQTCNCPTLEYTESIRYLGVIVDNHLKWKQHIDSVRSRLKKLIFIFKKLRSVIEFDSLITIYLALAQSNLAYCLLVWGGAHKSAILHVERGQRAVLKVLAKKPIRFPTVELFSICKVLSTRQLYVLKTVMRKHSQLTYDPYIYRTKRRFDRVCEIVPRKTAAASRHFKYISPKIYNKINKTLKIYSLTKGKLKYNLIAWLKSLTYDETEKLVEV